MKKILFLLLPAVLVSACKREKGSLSGHFENAPSAVFLDEILPDEIRTADTLLLVNGSFTYRFNRREEGLFRLRFSDTSLLSFVAGSDDRLEVEGDARDLPHTYRIRGNVSSEMLWEANRRVNGMYALTDSLSRIFKAAQAADSLEAVVGQLDSCYHTHFLSCRACLASLIENHPGELAVLPVFYQHIGTRPFFSETTDSVLFRDMVKKLTEAHPENPHVKALQERLNP